MEKLIKKGKIISINKDLYTVKSDNSVFPCYVRGKLKGTKLTVGDNVEIDVSNKTIESVEKRKNTLIRPLISNIDKLFIVQSMHIPEYSNYLIDKFLVLSEINHIEPIIIITKLDLASKDEKKSVKRDMKYYKKIGIKVYTNKDIRKIKREIKNSVVSLAGQTGAGKSTLLNMIDETLELQTGEVSEALGRGKHTTRLVTLHEVCGGLIADTPGFSSLELDLNDKEIASGFREFNVKCKYTSCTHVGNDGCEVIRLVKSGHILESRYNNYLKLIKE